MESTVCLQMRMSVGLDKEGVRGVFCRLSLQSCAKIMRKYCIFLPTADVTHPVYCMKPVSSQRCCAGRNCDWTPRCWGFPGAWHKIWTQLDAHSGFPVSGMCGSVLVMRSLTVLHRCSKLNLKCVVLENGWYVCPGLHTNVSVVIQLKLFLHCPGLAPMLQLKSKYNIY